MTVADAVKKRPESNWWAAALTRGPVEVLDFFLPLWAGAGLGAGPAQVGLLTAVETLTSFVVRPIAGVLADRFDRGRVAAVGALLYALSFAGYVLADSLTLAYPSAFLGGAGGALFWVALRARVGEGLRDDSAAYAKLFAAEGNGTWIAFVAAMSLVSSIDYQGVYAVSGVACLLAGVLLLLPDGMPPAEREHLPGLREAGRCGRCWRWSSSPRRPRPGWRCCCCSTCSAATSWNSARSRRCSCPGSSSTRCCRSTCTRSWSGSAAPGCSGSRWSRARRSQSRCRSRRTRT